MQVKDGDHEFGMPNRKKVRDKLSKRPIHVSEMIYQSFNRNYRVFWAFNTLEGILEWYEKRMEDIYFYHAPEGESSNSNSVFLMIGLTRYELPSKDEDFENFIRHCLDIEAAFFDNEDCQRVLDEAGSMS